MNHNLAIFVYRYTINGSGFSHKYWCYCHDVCRMRKLCMMLLVVEMCLQWEDFWPLMSTSTVHHILRYIQCDCVPSDVQSVSPSNSMAGLHWWQHHLVDMLNLWDYWLRLRLSSTYRERRYIYRYLLLSPIIWCWIYLSTETHNNVAHSLRRDKDTSNGNYTSIVNGVRRERLIPLSITM